MDKTTATKLSAVAAAISGIIFIGHGALAAQKDILWVDLFEQSMRFLPGGAPETNAVASLTQAIGIADIIFGLMLLALGPTLLFRPIRTITTSLIVLLAIAVFWQFMTSIAFIIADGTVNPGVWHLLERAGSFGVPVMAIFSLLHLHRSK